jgi:hypothetical protein
MSNEERPTLQPVYATGPGSSVHPKPPILEKNSKRVRGNPEWLTHR